MLHSHAILIFFFFNDTATTEIYTLSLHDALPILIDPFLSTSTDKPEAISRMEITRMRTRRPGKRLPSNHRSEEHTSELQSRLHLVCRLLLEKKNNYFNKDISYRSITRWNSTPMYL